MRKHKVFSWSGNWYFICGLCSATETATRHPGACYAGDVHVRKEHGVDAGGVGR